MRESMRALNIRHHVFALNWHMTGSHGANVTSSQPDPGFVFIIIELLTNSRARLAQFGRSADVPIAGGLLRPFKIKFGTR